VRHDGAVIVCVIDLLCYYYLFVFMYRNIQARTTRLSTHERPILRALQQATVELSIVHRFESATIVPVPVATLFYSSLCSS
jgi:hypothetical protein